MRRRYMTPEVPPVPKLRGETELEAWLSRLGFKSATETDADGWSPLRYAVMEGREDIARALLDAGAVVEPHSIPGTNITSAVPTAPISADKTDRSDALAAYITRIAFPSSESTIPMGPGDFVVEAEISPRLDSGEQLILLLDGETVGAPQAVPRWQLTNVFRGAHRLQVVRVSETGAAQSQSSEHAVYVMRPTVSRWSASYCATTDFITAAGV